MADEKTNSEKDSTGNSAFAMQTDEDIGFLSMQNEMAGPVGIADDHTHDRSSLNPGFTAGFSEFANNVDGISNLAHNVGGSSCFSRNVGANSSMVKNASEFFGPAQNMHGCTLNNYNVHFVPGFSANMGAGFQVVDSNTGFRGPGFQAYQNRPVQTIVDGLFPERKGLQMPGQVMPVARGSGPPQASNVPIGPSHMRYITPFPPIVCPIQCTAISKKPSTHQSTSESTQATPSRTPVPEIYHVPPQAKTAASLSPLPGTTAFLQPASQSTTLPSQALTARPPSPLAKEMPSHHVLKGKSKIIDRARPPGQGKSAARGSGLAHASKASVGPSLKRGATQPPSIVRPGQRRATNHSSVPGSAQTASPLAHRSQNAPVPPQALTAASFPSFPQIADYLRPLSQSRAPPYPLQTLHPYSQMAREIPHISISQDSNRLPRPIGYSCCLCNIDLSFTPEGLILQPGIRPNTAVLPCGHHFHDHCLQQITPADQTENPPCIECQKHEIEEEKMK